MWVNAGEEVDDVGRVLMSIFGIAGRVACHTNEPNITGNFLEMRGCRLRIDGK